MKITNSLAVMLLLGVADAAAVDEAMEMQGLHHSPNQHELVKAGTKVLNATHTPAQHHAPVKAKDVKLDNLMASVIGKYKHQAEAPQEETKATKVLDVKKSPSLTPLSIKPVVKPTTQRVQQKANSTKNSTSSTSQVKHNSTTSQPVKLTKVPDPSPPLKIADEKREKKNKYV